MCRIIFQAASLCSFVTVLYDQTITCHFGCKLRQFHSTTEIPAGQEQLKSQNALPSRAYLRKKSAAQDSMPATGRINDSFHSAAVRFQAELFIAWILLHGNAVSHNRVKFNWNACRNRLNIVNHRENILE